MLVTARLGGTTFRTGHRQRPATGASNNPPRARGPAAPGRELQAGGIAVQLGAPRSGTTKRTHSRRGLKNSKPRSDTDAQTPGSER
jgi:hypothetical protein